MSFALPLYDRSEVNRAGIILAGNESALETSWAYDVLTNWRASHVYPINTFQATLRKRLKVIDQEAIVAQRLKRAPSVILKLQRFKTMKLAQMQDIGGLRAILGSVPRVRRLEAAYRESASFKHEYISSKDYIANPKSDGYRSIHLVYRYHNERVPAYDGLLLELQFRTRLQHAWATAVETMGTFLGEALKAGQGSREWREFFEVASAAIAQVEDSPPVPDYEHMSRQEVFEAVAAAENELHVLNKLRGFTIAADHIRKVKGAGTYHLIVLDSMQRTVTIHPFPAAQLEQANVEYAKIEERTQRGELIEAVLVSAGPIEALMKAYPNYFLDTQGFVAEIQRVITMASADHAHHKRRRSKR